VSEDNPLPAGVAPQRAVETANEAMRGTLMERMGIEWLEVGRARLVARMPVAGNAHVYGLFHGGATAPCVRLWGRSARRWPSAWSAGLWGSSSR